MEDILFGMLLVLFCFIMFAHIIPTLLGDLFDILEKHEEDNDG